jgi:hypothetical protein
MGNLATSLTTTEQSMIATAYEILTAAQDLIRDPKRWTRGAAARDAKGEKVGALNPAATCWCADGAIVKCGGGEKYGTGSNIAIKRLFLIEPREPAGIVHVNDDKGHAAVMAMFDRLREKAKALEVPA